MFYLHASTTEPMALEYLVSMVCLSINAIVNLSWFSRVKVPGQSSRGSVC